MDAQRALTVKVERVPPRLRSRKALRRKFEHLCGAGTVHSAQPMVGDLRELNKLVARRDRAHAAWEDAKQRGAKLARDAEKKLVKRHGETPFLDYHLDLEARGGACATRFGSKIWRHCKSRRAVGL